MPHRPRPPLLKNLPCPPCPPHHHRLEEAHTQIGRTLTHEIYLKGSGFTKVFPPMLVFDPHIEKDDFVVQVSSSSREDDRREKVFCKGAGYNAVSWCLNQCFSASDRCVPVQASPVDRGCSLVLSFGRMCAVRRVLMGCGVVQDAFWHWSCVVVEKLLSFPFGVGRDVSLAVVSSRPPYLEPLPLSHHSTGQHRSAQCRVRSIHNNHRHVYHSSFRVQFSSFAPMLAATSYHLSIPPAAPLNGAFILAFIRTPKLTALRAICTFRPKLSKAPTPLPCAAQVMNRTSIKVSLAGKGSEARGWLPEGQTGTLSVRVINTGGGMFQFEKVRRRFLVGMPCFALSPPGCTGLLSVVVEYVCCVLLCGVFFLYSLVADDDDDIVVVVAAPICCCNRHIPANPGCTDGLHTTCMKACVYCNVPCTMMRVYFSVCLVSPPSLHAMATMMFCMFWLKRQDWIVVMRCLLLLFRMHCVLLVCVI